MTIAIECHNNLNVVDVLSHVASWLCHLMKMQRSFRACDIIHARVFVHVCVGHACVYMHNLPIIELAMYVCVCVCITCVR